MAGAQIRSTGSRCTDAAMAACLSAVFVVVALATSPLMAAAVVVPASIAVGWRRAHTLPTRIPHSLSVPVFSPTAVVRAQRVSGSAGDTGVTTAA